MIKQLFKSKLVWGAVVVSVLMAFLAGFSYLGAFLDPTDNTHDMPIAVVNLDQGLSTNGQTINYGQQVAATLLAPQSSDTIKWTALPSREAAETGLKDNRYYAALVIPANYSASLAGLATLTGTAPATIEILTNQAAGTYASSITQSAAQTAVTTVSQTTSAQLAQKLTAAGVKIPPTSASLLGNPVQAKITAIVPVGTHSARGLSAFYFALMLTLAGYLGSNIITILLARVVADRTAKNQIFTNKGLLLVKTVTFVVMSVLVGVAVSVIAVGGLGMDAPDLGSLILFGILVVLSTSLLSLLFQEAFGQAGLLVGVIVFTILGVPSSGGAYPVQMLPDFFQWLNNFLPLRFATDGIRSILFFGSNSEAGLGTATLVLSLYTVGGLAFAWLVGFVRDRLPGQPKPVEQLAPANSPAL